MNKIKKGGENRCQFKKTNNIIKLEKQIRLLYRRLANIRSNHIHQARNKIVKGKPLSKMCSWYGTIKKDLKLKDDRIYQCSCGLKIEI